MVEGAAAASRPGRRTSGARPSSRRRFGLVLVATLTVAAGSAQTIAALRGAVDQSRDAATVVARLDGQVNRQAALRWEAVAPGAVASQLGDALRETREAIAVLLVQLRLVERTSFGLQAVTLTAGEYQTALEVQVAAIADDASAAARIGRTTVAPAYDAFVRAQDEAALRLGEVATSTAAVADLGTLGSLLSAAILVSLLFRSWERGRRRGAYEDGETAGVRLSEARFRSLVQHSSDLISVIGRDGVVAYASPSIKQLLGAAQTLVGVAMTDVVHPDDRLDVAGLIDDEDLHRGPHKVEWRMRHASGEWRTFENVASEGHGSLRGFIVVNSRDITERKRLEGALRHQANHDHLTGLGNRSLLLDGLNRALARSRRTRATIALFLLDLDDFKTINDTLGHGAGDQLLTELAGRLRAAVRAESLVARIGGDEFAIVVEDLDEEGRASAVAARIHDALRLPFQVGPRSVPVSVSIGIATATGGAPGIELLMRQADIAMYAAKRRGRGEFQVFEPAMHDAALERLEHETELRRAVEKREFVVHYQAICDLGSGAVVGFEALVRWAHPKRGLLHPAEFLPLAEQTGLIADIDGWVLTEATRQLAAWDAAPTISANHWVSVNLSPRRLMAPDCVKAVRAALAASGLRPQRLVLELTEHSVMVDADAGAEVVAALRALGVRLAIDDFGTGYSALGRLHRFAFDMLKIDRSFIADLAGHDDEPDLVPTIVDLARRLGLTSIAEGIETPEELNRLRELGCQLGQGFLLHRPEPAEVVTRWMRTPAAPSGSVRDGWPRLAPAN